MDSAWKIHWNKYKQAYACFSGAWDSSMDFEKVLSEFIFPIHKISTAKSINMQKIQAGWGFAYCQLPAFGVLTFSAKCTGALMLNTNSSS